MDLIKCSDVWVRDRRKRLVLHWRRPFLGSLIIHNQGRRISIQWRGTLGYKRKTYISSAPETVETEKKAWWWLL